MAIQFEDLRKYVPSAFATAPAPHVSEKYRFVRTADILEPLCADGWQVVHARQQKVRTPEKLDRTKHLITLRKGNTDIAPQVGGVYPTLNLMNSNDWSSILSMSFGMFVLRCTNGLMTGTEFESYRVRHDQINEDLENIIQRFMSASTKLADVVDLWSSVQLTSEQVSTFGSEAARIRFGDSATSDHSQAIMLPRRALDAQNNLWNVFNRAQENAIQGSVRLGSMRRPGRRINNIRREVDVNNELFDLASHYALELTA